MKDKKIEYRKNVGVAFVFKNKGDWMATYSDFEKGINPTQEMIDDAWQWIKENNLDVIWLEDDEYPEKFKGKFYKPPFVIFVDKDGNYILDTEMNFETGKKLDQIQR